MASIRARVAFAALCALLGSAGSLWAQKVEEEDEKPLILDVEFRGAERVPDKELRLGLATQPTRCKALLLKPFCWFSESGFFVEKHRLESAEVKRDELRLRVHYWRRGYRYAQVNSSIDTTSDGVNVIFHIVEGSPVIAERVTVQQTNEVLNERQIRRAGMLREGRPLDMIVLDTAKYRLNIMLWDRGFGDAVVADSAQLLDSLRAAVHVTIDPKPRTTVGDVLINGNESVTDRTVRRLVDLRTGQLYRRSDVLAAQRRLYRSELFKQALLDVPLEQDSSKDVVVNVREAPGSAVRFGGGFNNCEFAQGEAEWTRYNWIGTARRLDLRGAVGNILAPQLYGQSMFGCAPPGVSDDIDASFLDPTWRLSASVTQPWFISTRNALGASIYAHRRVVPGVVVDRGYGASATFTRQMRPEIPASLTYRFEQNRVEGGDLYFCVNFGVCEISSILALSTPHRLSPLVLTAFADRADDPLAPSRGYTARLELEHASAATFSDFRYNRIGAETAYYLRAGRGTLAGHLRGGWIRPSESTANAVDVADTSATLLHPNRRFYAGGARSVRGYGENQLGPRVLTISPSRLLGGTNETVTPCTQATLEDGTCDPNVASSRYFTPRPIGGATLVEASVEYRMPLTQTIFVAAFVDAGRVGPLSAESQSEARTAITPGVGFRYRSPIGPIRVDLGMRPSTMEELPVVTQVLGPDGQLRLVQLRTRMKYDPLDTSGSGLLKSLARFQLHLAIGEAF
jgi:outer membrane protein assembly factor BamA